MLSSLKSLFFSLVDLNFKKLYLTIILFLILSTHEDFMQMCFLSYYRSTCTIPSVLPLDPQVKSISSLYRKSAPVKVMLFPCWWVMLKVAGLVWPMRCKRKCAGCDSGNAVFLQIPQGWGWEQWQPWGGHPRGPRWHPEDGRIWVLVLCWSPELANPFL